MRRVFNFVVLCVTFLIFGNNNVFIREATCQNTDDIRLSPNVRPTNYEIHLQVYLNNANNLADWKFEGEETIYVNIYDESTDFIEIHALDLEILKIQVFDDNSDTEIHILTQQYFNTTEKFLIKLDEELEPQRSYRIYVEFKGEIKDDMKGLYISSYYVFDWFIR